MLVKTLQRNFYGWMLVLPFVITLVVFFVFALIRTVKYSFTDYDLFSPANFVGIDNFLNLLTDELFIRATINTVSFSLVVTMTQTVLALGLAVLLNSRIKAKSFFRTAFYVPSILSSASVTLIFIWIYQKNGFLNGFLSQLSEQAPYFILGVAGFLIIQLIQVAHQKHVGLPCTFFDPLLALISAVLASLIIVVVNSIGWLDTEATKVAVNWLGSRDDFGPMPVTLWAITIQNIYTTVPTIMLLFLAGLQTIPHDLYEAADIDGANKWQQLIHITVPQLAPVTFVVVTLSIIGTLQMFDQVALLGTSSPLESRITLAYYVYHQAFSDGGTPNVGASSAAALILGVLTLCIVFIQNKFGVKEKS